MLPAFRPWNPRSWSSLPLLSALILLQAVILFGQLRVNFRQNRLEFERPEVVEGESIVNYQSLSLLLILLLLAIKSKSLINERYEAHSIFERGKVPSVQNKHFLSGNLFELIVPNNNIKIQEAYHKKLGKTYGMFYGPDPWVLTIDPDLLQRVFAQEINRTQYRLPFLTEFSKSLAQIQAGPWRRQRKTLNPFFTCHQMKKDNVFEDVEQACGRLLDSILAHPDQRTTGNESSSRLVDVNYLFKKFSLEVIFQVAYGFEGGVDMTPFARNKLIDTIHEASYEIRSPLVWGCICFDNLERFIGQLAKFTKIGTYIGYIHEILDLSLSRRRKLERVSPIERKMIDTIIECIDENKMDYESVRSNLFFLLLAGFETTANTLATMFWLLARNPEVQEQLREAILIDAEQATFLEWTIQETLRLYPAVPSGIGRILTDDLEHEQMKFFKGTTINASIYVLHRDQRLWGQDAERFRPSRFQTLKLHPAQYFAFGHGPRYCMGMNLAMAELRAITSKILAKFRIEVDHSTPEELQLISPNVIHMILEGQINLRFLELSSI